MRICTFLTAFLLSFCCFLWSSDAYFFNGQPPPKKGKYLADFRNEIDLVAELKEHQLLGKVFFVGKTAPFPPDLELPYLVARPESKIWYEIDRSDGGPMFTGVTYELKMENVKEWYRGEYHCPVYDLDKTVSSKDEILRKEDGYLTDIWPVQTWMKGAVESFLPSSTGFIKLRVRPFGSHQIPVIVAGEPKWAVYPRLINRKDFQPTVGKTVSDLADKIGVYMNEYGNALHYFQSPNDVLANINDIDAVYYVTIGKDLKNWYLVARNPDKTELVFHNVVWKYEDGEMVEYSLGQFVISQDNAIENNAFIEKGARSSLNNVFLGHDLPFGIELGGKFFPVHVHVGTSLTKAGLCFRPNAPLSTFQHHIGLIGQIADGAEGEQVQVLNVQHYANYDVAPAHFKNTSPDEPSSPFLITIGNDASTWYRIVPNDDGTVLVVDNQVLKLDGDTLVQEGVENGQEKYSLKDWIASDEAKTQPFGVIPGELFVPILADKVVNIGKAGLVIKHRASLSDFQSQVGLVGELYQASDDTKEQPKLHNVYYNDEQHQALDFFSIGTFERPSVPFLLTIGSDSQSWYKVIPNDEDGFTISDQVFKVDGDTVTQQGPGNMVTTYSVQDWIAPTSIDSRSQSYEFRLGSVTVPVHSLGSITNPDEVGITTYKPPNSPPQMKRMVGGVIGKIQKQLANHASFWMTVALGGVVIGAFFFFNLPVALVLSFAGFFVLLSHLVPRFRNRNQHNGLSDVVAEPNSGRVGNIDGTASSSGESHIGHEERSEIASLESKNMPRQLDDLHGPSTPTETFSQYVGGSSTFASCSNEVGPHGPWLMHI